MDHHQVWTRQKDTSSLAQLINEHPYLFALGLITFICIFTRIRSGLQAQYQCITTSPGAVRSVPMVPYFIPLLGHSISFALGFEKYLMKVAYKIPTPIFAINLGGATQHVVVAPSLVKELLHKPNMPLDFDSFVYRFITYAFGDGGYIKAWDARNKAEVDGLTGIIHGLMRDPFLGETTALMVKGVEDQAINLVSGNPSWVDHAIWERSGGVEIVETRSDGSFTAEADLFALVRNFIGYIATSSLMGHEFLENNPSALEDMWMFDEKMPMMMLGLPNILVPGMLPAIGGRERLFKAVTEHHDALMDYLEGKDPGYKYTNLHDVSTVIKERARGFRKAGVPPRIYGIGDALIIWAMNVNANQVMFWMIFYIYSRPELLQEIRNEVAPYIDIHQAQLTGLPIKEAPRLKMDVNSLCFKCPKLKGALLEAMRLEVSASSFRLAADDMVVSESAEDALRLGRHHAEKYHIKKGDIICVPMQVPHRDPRFFANPEEFNAERFWTKGNHENGETQIRVEYGNLRPWGAGKSMCKGRAFAEREANTIVAAIISLWDIEPVAESGWKHPGHKSTIGTYAPKKDIRVKIRRRSFRGV